MVKENAIANFHVVAHKVTRLVIADPLPRGWFVGLTPPNPGWKRRRVRISSTSSGGPFEPALWHVFPGAWRASCGLALGALPSAADMDQPAGATADARKVNTADAQNSPETSKTPNSEGVANTSPCTGCTTGF